MSGIPPANLVTGVIGAIVSEKQRADEKKVEDRRRAQQAAEQAKLSDQQEHQVEETEQTEMPGVRRHDDEEAHQRNRYKYHRIGDKLTEGLEEEDEGHIDLTA